MTRLILGTSSQRRIELLSRFSLPFRVIVSNFDEFSIPFDLPPNEYVKQIAQGKAALLANQYPDNLILTADTSVYFDNRHFGKPTDREDAIATLKQLRGREHQVWTGLCLAYEGKYHIEEDMTTVLFNDVPDEAICHYVDTFNPLDKAGSYAIQDAAGLLVNRISGNYQNVIGFPLTKVAHLLQLAEINLWDYLKKPS